MDSKICEKGKVEVLGRCIKADSSQVYNRLLKDAEQRGFDHMGMNIVVRNTFVATAAEVEAGKRFNKWVLEDIGNRYGIIGGKTWKAGNNMLFPVKLVQQRRGLNIGLWDEYPRVD